MPHCKSKNDHFEQNAGKNDFVKPFWPFVESVRFTQKDHLIFVSRVKLDTKMIKTVMLLVVAGVFATISQTTSWAQTSSNQSNEANALQEGSYYGYFNENVRDEGCDKVRYKLDPVYPTISNIKKENGNVVSFVFDCGLSYRKRTMYPDRSGDAITSWDERVVLHNGDIYVLSADPYRNNDFCIERWYTKGKLKLAKSFKIADQYKKGTLAPPVSKEALKEIIATSIAARKAVDDAKQANLDAQYAAHRESYSIKGKEVENIAFINFTVPDKFGHFRGFAFDIQATLKDGSTISTASEGYLDDYNITYSAENYQSRGFEGMVLESGFVDNDVITVNVTSKYHNDLSISKEVVLKYNEDVPFFMNGNSVNMGNASNADNYRIEVKQVPHATTGKKLLKIRITNVSEGSVLSEFKMEADRHFSFSCNGGNAGESNSHFGIGNGGNGGNLTVIKDPNVDYFNFDYSNNGGNAGPAYNAARGRDGQYKEETRPVKF